MVTVGVGNTVTVPVFTIVVAVPPAVSCPLIVTEYTVVVAGLTVTLWVVCPPGFQENVGLKRLVLAVSVVVLVGQIV